MAVFITRNTSTGYSETMRLTYREIKELYESLIYLMEEENKAIKEAKGKK